MVRSKADKFLTVEQVADMTALSVKTIWAGKCGTEELLRVKLGHRTVFSKNDVDAWIAQRLQRARDKQDMKKRSKILAFVRCGIERNEVSEVLEQIEH